MRGFVRVPQFWGYARTWDELCGPPKGDALIFSQVVGPVTPKLEEKQPAADFGTIVLRVDDDGGLELVGHNVDSSG